MFLSALLSSGSLSEAQLQQLQSLLAHLSPMQKAWLSGYLASQAQQAGVATLPTGEAGTLGAGVPVTKAATNITVLFGSQTGNAKHVAEDLAKAVSEKGLKAKAVSMADYKTNLLKSEQYLVIVCSTYGEGEPPENAEIFYQFLHGKKAPELKGLKYAVLGLGDESYEFFCKTAQDFDQRLAALGAQSIYDRANLDVDYETQAANWVRGLVEVLKRDIGSNAASSENTNISGSGMDSAPIVTSQYNKKTPFLAELLTNQKITARESGKDVRHIEISLQGSNLQYQPGDALGVYFCNAPELVQELLELTGTSGESVVSVNQDSLTLEKALLDVLELTQSYPGFVEQYAIATQQAKLTDLVADKKRLRAYLEPRQIIDIVRDYPAPIQAQALVDALRRMQPRLYSIASSQKEVENEVHITLAVVRYEEFGSTHLGGASGFLAERLHEGGKVQVFIERNDNFRLPVNDDMPVIMIGPGTGIAPFRAFLQEREARDAAGKNWLFFGNPHFTQDFLYQLELQGYLKRRVLSRLNTAFSRDQSEKIYVQDRLREQGKELYEWLQQGAYIYICGDANHMAKDVHQAFLEIISLHGNLSAEQAQEYLNTLREEKRFQKDVY